jgi:hypothetical protein
MDCKGIENMTSRGDVKQMTCAYYGMMISVFSMHLCHPYPITPHDSSRNWSFCGMPTTYRTVRGILTPASQRTPDLGCLHFRLPSKVQHVILILRKLSPRYHLRRFFKWHAVWKQFITVFQLTLFWNECSLILFLSDCTSTVTVTVLVLASTSFGTGSVRSDQYRYYH